MKKLCEVKDCKNPAKFALNKVEGKKKKWIQVCDQHEREIGEENLARAGGPATKKEK